MRLSTRGLTPFMAEDIKAGKIEPQEREAIFEAGQELPPRFAAPALEGP